MLLETVQNLRVNIIRFLPTENVLIQLCYFHILTMTQKMLRRYLLEILGCTPLISPLPSLNLLASVYPQTISNELNQWT